MSNLPLQLADSPLYARLKDHPDLATLVGTAATRALPSHRSFLWIIREGRVLIASGVRHVDDTRSSGVPYESYEQLVTL